MSATSAQIRDELLDALALDLIGPYPDDRSHDWEEIDKRPSIWYLSGFLVPYEAKFSDRIDPTADDEFNEPNDSKSDDDPAPEANSARKVTFPSSMGLSFLVDGETGELEVTATWGDYEPRQRENSAAPTEEKAIAAGKSSQETIWCRTPRRERLTLPVPHHLVALPEEHDVDRFRLVVAQMAP